MSINRINIMEFLDNYLIYILLGFSLLTLLPYVSFFKYLQIIYTSGIIYRGILSIVICASFLFIIFIYKNNIPNYIWIISIIYLASQITTIIISPIITETSVPTLTLIMGFGQAVSVVISTLCYLFIQRNCMFSNRSIDLVCLFMIGLGLLLCVYSYIFQWEAIYNTFNTIYGWNYDVTSIFTLKTEYGFTLFICSVFSFFYIIRTKRYWLYIFPIFFILNMFMSRSKTSILCTSIILVILLVITFIETWPTHKGIWITLISITIVLLITVMFLTIFKIWWFEKFNYYISEVIIGDAKVVFDDRVHKWSLLLKSVDNPFNIIFGYGERITPYILSKCGCSTIGDNIYISTYGVGGLIKLSFYLVIGITSFKHNIRNLPPIYKVITITIMSSFLIAGIFEDDSIIGITSSSLLSSIIYHNCRKLLGNNIDQQ